MFLSVFIGFIILCIIAVQQLHFTTHDIIIPTSNQYDTTNNYNRTITNRRRLWPKLISDPKTLEKINRNSKITREDFNKYKYGEGYDDNSLILPNILFLGAQKAGSTSVRMLLCLFLSVRFILYNDCLLVSYRYIYILNVRYYASTYLFLDISLAL